MESKPNQSLTLKPNLFEQCRPLHKFLHTRSSIATLISLFLFPLGLASAQKTTLDQEIKPRYSISKETTFYTSPLTKDGHVDYRAIINRKRQPELSHKNNLAIDLFQVFGLPHFHEADDRKFLAKELGLKEIKDEQQCFMSWFSFLYQLEKNEGIEIPPSRQTKIEEIIESQYWNREEFPLVSRWLSENADYLRHFSNAIRKRSYYYIPFYRSHYEQRDQLFVGEISDLEYALHVRILNSMHEDRFDLVMDDYETVLRIEQLQMKHPSWLSFSWNSAHRVRSLDILLTLLSSKKLIEEEVAQLRELVWNFDDSPKYLDTFVHSRLTSLWEIQQLSMSEPGDSERNFSLENLADFDFVDSKNNIKESDLDDDGELQPYCFRVSADHIDWDRVMQHFNEEVDSLEKLHSIADSAKRTSQLAAFVDKRKQNRPKLSFASEKQFDIAFNEDATNAKYLLTNDVTILVVENLNRPEHQYIHASVEFRGKMYVDFAKLALELKQYHLTHQTFPENLSQLDQRIHDLIDPFNGKPYAYVRKSENECVIYGVFENLTDDGGLGDSTPIFGDKNGDFGFVFKILE